MGFHEADTGDPIVILVLGPMDPKGGDPIPRTVRLKKIIEAAVSQLKREYSNEKFEVQAPEDLKAGPIITAILDLIEGADLIIADLAENSPSVAYEVAIVQALGIPMILVTGERGVPFYFTTSLYIGEFVIDTEVDLRTPENVKSKFYNSLIERLRDFVGALCKIRDSSTGEKAYKYANERIKPYVTNQLTEHFGDLPIVDIAGPSSLAAGYYLNAVSRFAWPDRFFDGKFFLNPVPRDGEEAAPAEVASEISKFFIVFPPEPMSNYPDDNKKLQNMLEKNGFRIEQRVIRDPFNKLRPYTGSFLAKENGGLLDPAIVLEIPTTLYALQRVPRVRRLAKHPRRDALRRRRIDGMLSSFERTLDNLMIDDNIGERRDRVLFTRFRHLTEKLAQLRQA